MQHEIKAKTDTVNVEKDVRPKTATVIFRVRVRGIRRVRVRIRGIGR